MAGWRLRDFHPDDFDGILRLWQEVTATDPAPVYGLAEVLASCEKDHAIVAAHGEEIIGAAVGRAAHAQGWIVFVATTGRRKHLGIGASMLAALETRMVPLGLSKLSALMPDTGTRVEAFVQQGYELKKNLRYFERQIPVQREELRNLTDLGGRLLPRNLWDEVGGMIREKDLLERRLVMPLARAELAEQFGVAPPRQVRRHHSHRTSG